MRSTPDTCMGRELGLTAMVHQSRVSRCLRTHTCVWCPAECVSVCPAAEPLNKQMCKSCWIRGNFMGIERHLHQAGLPHHRHGA